MSPLDNWSLSLLDALFGVILVGFGFLLNALWTAVRDLQKADTELASKVSQVEILVAGAYVKKDELASIVAALHARFDRFESTHVAALDRLSAKLEGKADR